MEQTAQEMPAFQQDVASANAPNGQFHVQAAVNVQEVLKSRQMELMEYRFSDTNHDLSQEIVSLSKTTDAQRQNWLVVSVYDFDEALNPILRYEKKQQLTAGAGNKGNAAAYEQHVAAADPGFSVCEDWHIASWEIHECHQIQLDRGWAPRVIAHEIETSEPKAHSSQKNIFNFGSRIAARAYTRLPEGAFMPALSRYSQYVMIFSAKNDSLEPAPARLETTQTSDFSTHAPFHFASSWNASGVYFSFDFNDQDVIFSESCSDALAVQQSDHAELWFDLNPGLNIDRNHPESWMMEYEKDYQNEPYRHHIDSDIYGVGITPGGCVIPLTPTREQWTAMPEVQVETTEDGYHMDVFVPAKFYGVDSLDQMPRSLGLGFTARQHDFHGGCKYSDTATSEFRWPDPFTFGQIWLMPDNAAYPPHYPLQWNRWLE